MGASWERCAITGCEKPRMGAAIYCVDCMQVFAGVPPKRKAPKPKPLPIVEPVTRTVEPYRSPAAKSTREPTDPLLRKSDLHGLVEELRFLRGSIHDLQGSRNGPPVYPGGIELRDMVEISGSLDIAAGQSGAIRISPQTSQYFRPFGVRMRVTPIGNERERLSLRIGAVIINGYPQEAICSIPIGIGTTAYMQSDKWDQPWPVPVPWGVLGLEALTAPLEIHAFNPYHEDAKAWVGVTGKPLHSADLQIGELGRPRGRPHGY